MKARFKQAVRSLCPAEIHRIAVVLEIIELQRFALGQMGDARGRDGREDLRHHQVFPVELHIPELFRGIGAVSDRVAQIVVIVVKIRRRVAEILDKGVRHTPRRFDVPVQIARREHRALVPVGLEQARNIVDLRAAFEQRLQRLVEIVAPIGVAAGVEYVVGHVRGRRVDKENPAVLPQRLAVAVEHRRDVRNGLGRILLNVFDRAAFGNEPERGALRLGGRDSGQGLPRFRPLRLIAASCRGLFPGIIVDHAKLRVIDASGLLLVVALPKHARQRVRQRDHPLACGESIGEIVLKFLHVAAGGDSLGTQLREGLQRAVFRFGHAAGAVGKEQKEQSQRQAGEKKDVVFSKTKILLHGKNSGQKRK